MTIEHPTNRDQYLLDIFTTAMEGGIGYWSQAHSYHHWLRQPEDRNDHDGYVEDHLGFYADIVDLEADDDEAEYAPTMRIDRGVIIKGYNLAATTWRNKLGWSSEPPPLVITADTDWDYDAGDADLIVQLGLFGDVLYG